MLRKKEDEKYFKIAVTGVAILLIGMVCFFLFIESADLALFHDLIGILEPFIYYGLSARTQHVQNYAFHEAF